MTGSKYYTKDKSYWYLVERIKDDKAFFLCGLNLKTWRD